MQVLKPTKVVIGGPGSGSGAHLIIEAHATFKTSEAAAAAAAEDGRGPAQRKGGFEVRAARTSKAQAKVNAAIAQAFQAKAQRASGGGGGAHVPSASRAAAPSQNGGCAVPKAAASARHPPVVKAESAAAAARFGAVSLPAVAPAPVVFKAEASLRAATVDAEATRPSGVQPEVKPGTGAASAAGASGDAASRQPRTVPDAVVAASVMTAQAGSAERDGDRRNGSRSGLPPPQPQVGGGALEQLAMANAGTAGMWGALGDMLGQAASAAPAAVSSSGGLGQLLSGAGVSGLGQLGYSRAVATPHAQAPGMSAAQNHLLGALGGGFGGLAFSGGLPAASAPAPPPPAPASIPATATGITAVEQEVIDALRAQAQLRTVQEAAAPAPPVTHPLQAGTVWPVRDATWGGAASAGMAAAAAAVARVSTPPPAEVTRRPDGVSPSESISPQHMELLAALLNGQDVRSHPGYQSLRQVLLGNQQHLTYDDLLRQRWSGQ